MAGGSDHKLVERAVGGDSVAVKLLLTETHEVLCARVARRIPADLRRLIDPEDIAQETHVEVFQRICDFEPRGEDGFERWVATIAMSRLRNAIVRHRTMKRDGRRLVAGHTVRVDDSSVALLDTLAGPGRTPSRHVARGEAIEAVQSALSTLPQHYREAIWLVHIEGRSVRDAANEMGRTERAIHGLCRRGLKLMQERLDRDGLLSGSMG